jgi:hypothetical protein
MSELLSKFDSGELIGLVAMTGGMALGLILGLAGILTYHFRRSRQLEMEAALKQDMLQRGLAAADIERVMRATSPEPYQGQVAPFLEANRELTDQEAEAQVAAALVTLGVDPDKIEQAVAAVRGAPRGTKQTVARMVAKMATAGADEDQVLAAVNSLCRSSAGVTRF